jgi:hypothetical protein
VSRIYCTFRNIDSDETQIEPVFSDGSEDLRVWEPEIGLVLLHQYETRHRLEALRVHYGPELIMAPVGTVAVFKADGQVCKRDVAFYRYEPEYDEAAVAPLIWHERQVLTPYELAQVDADLQGFRFTHLIRGSS